MAFTTLAAFGADNSLGTWKFTAEKSKYSCTDAAQEPEHYERGCGWRIKVTTAGERTDGTKIDANYTAKYEIPQTRC
jgi:hypothetical protein